MPEMTTTTDIIDALGGDARRRPPDLVVTHRRLQLEGDGYIPVQYLPPPQAGVGAVWNYRAR